MIVCTVPNGTRSPFSRGLDCGGCSVGGGDLGRFPCSTASDELVKVASSDELLNLVSELDTLFDVVAMVTVINRTCLDFFELAGSVAFLVFGSCPLISISTFFGAFSGV